MTSYMDIVEAFDGYTGPKKANLVLLGSIFLTIFVTFMFVNTVNYLKNNPQQHPDNLV